MRGAGVTPTRLWRLRYVLHMYVCHHGCSSRALNLLFESSQRSDLSECRSVSPRSPSRLGSTHATVGGADKGLVDVEGRAGYLGNARRRV